MELVFCCYDYIKEKKVYLVVIGFCGYVLIWWVKVVKIMRFNGELQVFFWFELKIIMKKRFVFRIYCLLSLFRSFS